MKVNRQKLVSILSAIKPGLAKKQIVEEAAHFIFTGEDVLTYNDNICIIHPFQTDFKCSIAANEFYKIMANIETNEVELFLEDNKLKIYADKTKANLATSDGEKILSMINNFKLNQVMKNLIPLPEDFLKGAELCKFSASKNASNPILTCISIDKDSMTSSDDLRISQYKMKKSINCSILIPAKSVMELIKFPVIDYYISTGWIFFATKEDILFCSRLVTGKYYDCSEFFSFERGIEIDLPKEISKMIEISSILTEGEYDTDKFVDFEISNGKIKCKGENSVGWIENEIETVSKSTIKFSINPLFLIKILEYSSKMIYKDNRVLFSFDNFQHLMTLKAN